MSSHAGERARRWRRSCRRAALRWQRWLVVLLGAALLVHLVAVATALGGRAAFERTMQAWLGGAPSSVGLRWGLVYIPLLVHVGHRLPGALRAIRRATSQRRWSAIATRTWLGALALAYLFWHTGHHAGTAGSRPPGAAGAYDRWAAALSSVTGSGLPAVAAAHLAGVACSVGYLWLALPKRQRSARPWRAAGLVSCTVAVLAGWVTVLHFATGWPNG